VLALLQKRPCTSLKSELSANTISPSLRPSHLTSRPFPNSPTRTSDGSVHGGTTDGDIAWSHRPPGTCADPPIRSVTIPGLKSEIGVCVTITIISALASFVLPATGDVINLRVDIAGTLLGALCFLIGAAVMFPAWRRAVANADAAASHPKERA